MNSQQTQGIKCPQTIHNNRSNNNEARNGDEKSMPPHVAVYAGRSQTREVLLGLKT